MMIYPASVYSQDRASSIGTEDIALSENVSCSDLIELLTRQQQNTSRDLRLIKRDIAALNQKLEKPGIKDIVAGVGFILGLFGIGALIISRGNKKDSKR
ncbi:MAG: hypothetical protein KJO32_03110 [Deltaproteobacteria bacterium]|nr:hypothetical protein [Deltaproteobacteria bacterium]